MANDQYTIIAPVGDYLEEIFCGVKEFNTKEVILLCPPDKLKSAETTKKDLARLEIPTRIVELKGHPWEEIFAQVTELKTEIKDDEHVLVQVSTGDRDTRCAATSAAFVNGLRAFGIAEKKAWMLPVMRFSYYKILTDKKLKILSEIGDQECFESLEELSKKTGMSLPLISYHVNGNLKSEGLKELGLVETKENKGKTKICVSMMGRMLLRGYVPHEVEEK